MAALETKGVDGGVPLSVTTRSIPWLLDLGLPGSSGYEGGFEVLAWLAEREGVSSIPVIVFTGSEDTVHAQRAYELGVRRFMRKADDYAWLTEAVKEELHL